MSSEHCSAPSQAVASSVGEMISSVSEATNSMMSPQQQCTASWHMESELGTLALIVFYASKCATSFK